MINYTNILFYVFLVLATSCFTSKISKPREGFDISLNNKPHAYQRVKDPTGKFKESFVEKFELRSGDCGRNENWDDCKNDRERIELAQIDKMKTGTGIHLSFDFYLPHDFVQVFPVKLAIAQFHQIKSHVIWIFQVNDRGLSLDKQLQGYTTSIYPLIDRDHLVGHWHNIRAEIFWSKRQEGYFRLLINNEIKIDYKGQTSTSDEGIYFKYGLYRSFLSRWSQPFKIPTQVAYFSNIKKVIFLSEKGTP